MLLPFVFLGGLVAPQSVQQDEFKRMVAPSLVPDSGLDGIPTIESLMERQLLPQSKSPQGNDLVLQQGDVGNPQANNGSPSDPGQPGSMPRLVGMLPISIGETRKKAPKSKKKVE